MSKLTGELVVLDVLVLLLVCSGDLRNTYKRGNHLRVQVPLPRIIRDANSFGRFNSNLDKINQ